METLEPLGKPGDQYLRFHSYRVRPPCILFFREAHCAGFCARSRDRFSTQFYD
jgi:hypothetical protein